MRKSKISDGFPGRLPIVGLIVLLLGPVVSVPDHIAVFAQQPPNAPVAPGQGPRHPSEKSTISSAPTAPPAPVMADSELLLIFQAHRVTGELIEARLKAAGIPELQQEIRVLQARFDAWKKAHNVPPGWVWSDERKQFEPPAAAPGPTGAGSSQPQANAAKKEN